MQDAQLLLDEQGEGRCFRTVQKEMQESEQEMHEDFYVPLDGLHTRLGEGFRKATGSTRRAEHSAHYEKVT